MVNRNESTGDQGRPLLRVVKQSGLYALGNIAVKASGLILAPLYLNPAYLPVESYGYFALLSVSAQLGIFVAGLGLGSGLLKYMSDPAHADDQPALPFTALVSTVTAALAALAAFWIAAEALAAAMLDSGLQAGLIRLLGVYVALKVVGSIPLTVLRIRERAGWYAVAIAGEMVVLIGFAYYFLVVADEGLYGIMLALVLAAATSSLVLSAAMLSQVRWIFRLCLVSPLIRYGAPLVIAGLAGWFLNAGDRYLLKWLSEPEVIAVYEWSARMAGVLNLLFVQSFQLSFSVIGLKSAARGKTDLYRKAFRHYVVWTGWGVVGLSLLAYDVTSLLVVYFDADPVYLGVENLVFPVTLGFLSYGVYIIVNNILYAVGRTRLIGLNVLAAAILNGVLNVLLIPFFGGFGAAIATFAAFTVLALVAAYFAEQEIQVRYPWSLAAVILGMCVVLFALGHATVDWPIETRLPARVALVAAYPFILWAARLYSVKEIRLGWKELRSRGRGEADLHTEDTPAS